MSRIFSYGSPFWRIMGRITDLFFLSLLWALFSLPVITAGASTAALHYVTLKMAENREGGVFRTFCKGFKDNLRKGSLVWIFFLFAAGFAAGEVILCFRIKSTFALTMAWFFIMIGAMLLFFAMVVFPLMARLEAGTGKLIAISFMICIRHFSWILFITVMTVCITAVGVFVFWPVLFFAPGVASFISSYTFVKVIFPKYHWNSEDE